MFALDDLFPLDLGRPGFFDVFTAGDELGLLMARSKSRARELQRPRGRGLQHGDSDARGWFEI